MADNYVAVRIRTLDEARPDLDELRAKLDELKGRVAEARAEVTTAEADAQLTDLEAKLEAVGKKVERPSIDMAGATRANAQITAVEADLDKLDAKVTESAGVQEAAGAKVEASGGRWEGVGSKVKMAMLGIGIGAAAAVYEAGKFQDSTTHLVTDAGESAKNLGMVQQGILSVSAATGTSADQITDAMYHIESSGFHAASGLAILKTVAEGAKVGGADLDTTSKALVGTLTAYYGTSMTAGQATKRSTQLMNELIATVGSGDMRMQDLASSLHSVTAIAASAHVSFAQVGGAIATMTAQGMSAQQATQDLGHVIGALAAPTAVQSTEMKALGLNANAVAHNIGKVGLSGTLDELRDAVLKNTHGGSVFLGYLKEMSPAAQDLANKILAGKISTGDLTTAMKKLNPEQGALVTHFKAAAVSATGLQQTYTNAMSKMTGGQMGLNVALMLSGTHAQTFAGNVAAIQGAAAKSGSQVANWSTIQSTFNFKLQQAKESVIDMGISLGSALLPAVTAVVGPIAHMMAVIAGNKAESIALAVVIGGVLAGALGVKLAKGLKDAEEGIKAAGEGVEWLVKKLFGQKAAEEGAAAAAKKSSAEQVAASKESAAAAEEAAGAEETAAGEAAAANEEGAAESSGSWIAAAGQQMAAAAGWVADQAVKVGSAVASNVAGAASTAGAWAAAGAQQVAGAAVWVARAVAKVAVMVASNVAGAAVSAAAWVAANAAMLLGIGLVVAGVVAAVVLIVKHWKQITHAVAKVWRDVTSIAVKAVSEVVDFVRAHWKLLLAILLGPIAVASLEIAEHWRDIRRWFSDGVRFVRGVLSWFDGLAAMFGRWIAGAADAVWSEGARILKWYASLPGKVLGYLAGLPGRMLSIGENIVKGIWNGMTGAAGWLASKITGFASNILGDIGSAFGISSPAKKTVPHGMFTAMGFGNGLIAGIPYVVSAARKMAGAALGVTSRLRPESVLGSALGPAGGYGGWASGQPQQLELTLIVAKTGDPLLDQIFEGIRVQARHKGGAGPYSVQKAFGQRWPAGG